MTDFDFPINLQRTPCADKNDKLGWKAGFSLDLEGISFGVRCNDPDFLPELRACFPSRSQPSARREVEVLFSFLKGGQTARKGVVNYHLVYDAWNRAARTQDLGEAMNTFRTNLHNRLALMSQDIIYARASVLKWRGGGIVLLEAAPEVVHELAERGAEVFCADFARINQANQLENADGELLEPTLVVATRSTSKRSLTKLSPGATALALSAACPAMSLQAPRLLKGLSAFCQQVPGAQAVINAPGDLWHLLTTSKQIRIPVSAHQA